MVVVGFDVAKDSLVGARVNKNGIVKEHYILENNETDIRKVLVKLKSGYPHLLVVSEATGDYHRVLAASCLRLGIKFKLPNPLLVKRYIRTNIRKLKTDKSDAEAIARVALMGEGNLLTEADLSLAKPYLRTSITLIETSQICNLLEQRMAALAPDRSNLLAELDGCRELLRKTASTYREEAMYYTDPTTRKLLTSIPGIADNLATDILIEIGDITRFKGPKQLVGFAGLDPKVLQSGKTLNRYGHLTKRGSPTLRRALFIAASVAKRCDPVCRSVYDKKRAEGKRYKEANIVVARKLLRIIYAVWVSGRSYVVRS